MIKPRINRDYKKCSAIKRETRALSVLQSMTRNANFPSPPVKMEDLARVQTQYASSRVDAENRDRIKGNEKKKIAAELIAMLDQLADYVTDVANGDASILLSSGFDIVTSSKGAGFGPITDFAVKVSNTSGEAVVSCATVDYATGYAVHYAMVTDGVLVWKAVMGSVTKYVITDLEPGKTYVFCMEAVGTKKKSIKSEEIRRIIP
ncbi:MAG: fibronectin type III domain-containing protein [Chitinophagaceae bacterium]